MGRKLRQDSVGDPLRNDGEAHGEAGNHIRHLVEHNNVAFILDC